MMKFKQGGTTKGRKEGTNERTKNERTNERRMDGCLKETDFFIYVNYNTLNCIYIVKIVIVLPCLS